MLLLDKYGVVNLQWLNFPAIIKESTIIYKQDFLKTSIQKCVYVVLSFFINCKEDIKGMLML